MAFVQFSKVSLAFGNRDILKDVSIHLMAGTKAALTGANGSGKSTLIKILAGISEPDSGERSVQKGCRIAYLPQSGLVHKGATLLEEADKAFLWGYELQKQADAVGEKMQNCEPALASRLAEEQAAILAQLEESGWYRRRALAEEILLGLGFLRDDFSKQTDEFSGGWQMRIALAKALMCKPDILLLDEPTNYLDIEARDWLEAFLSDFTGGFLLVSHDRYFLDHTVTEVYELFSGALKRYPGNFSHYEAVRQGELETLIAEYEKQEAQIAHLEDFINRFGYKASKAAQAQERQKMLDKILENKIEIPESLKKIHFTFPPAPHSGNIVLKTEGLCKEYVLKGRTEPARVICNLDLVLEKGERLVVAGKNGAGKSTLLRIIAQKDSAFSGTIQYGAGVSIGYFSQDSAEKITGSETILSRLESKCPLHLLPKARDMLGAFLFRGDDVFKSIDVLSGGEKSRLALLELLLTPVNVLVLDEPTNHLDIHSKDVLLQALKDFGGTLIFVSHDRGFIEDLATRVLELRYEGKKDGSWRVFPGDFRYYTERLAQEAGLQAKTEALDKNQQEKKAPKEQNASEQKVFREEQKKAQSDRRKKERELEKLEADIKALEEQKAALEKQLSLPEVYTDGAKAKAVQQESEAVSAALEKKNELWEALAMELEA